MAPTDNGGSRSSKEAEGELAPAPTPLAAAVGRAVRHGPMLRLATLQLMLFAAHEIVVGAARPPVPLPRLLAAFVAWLVGFLSLFVALMA
uniref:Uncharacterized protein n=1 Tax=Leersia perrieri TaxID=77586 RepID=A0A0D9VHW5_9ORYZ